jgi:hypothetical protein
VQPVLKEHKALKEFKVSLAQLELKVFKVQPAQLVQPELKEHKVFKVLQVQLVPPVRKVFKAQQVLPVQPVRPAPQVRRVYRVSESQVAHTHAQPVHTYPQ